jgi:hypothetical protein
VEKMATWCVCEGGPGAMGRVISCHQSRQPAECAASRPGRYVESARIVQLVQSGLSYTNAVQLTAGLSPARKLVTVIEVRP